MTTAYGIDVSYYQGQINWNQVYAAGKRFAICRATLGHTYTDPTYRANANGARAASLAAGAYHVFKPSQDPETQANHFYAVAGRLQPGDIIPWVDAELTEPLPDRERVNLTDLAQALAECIYACEQLFGKPVGVYTGAWWWNQLPVAERAHTRWNGLPGWFATYGATPGAPLKPSSWTHYEIHQYSSTGHVAGVNGNCDLNYARDLEAITHQPATSDWKDKALASIAGMRKELTSLEATIKGVA